MILNSFYATYITERAESAGSLIVNKPQSLRDCNEKLFTTLVCRSDHGHPGHRSAQRLREFHKNTVMYMIFKPLDGMGGASIFRLKQDDLTSGVIIETLTNPTVILSAAQNFLPAIKDGDKRILVVDGEPVPYCWRAFPAKRRNAR